jgi:hypothetical protein
VPRLARGSTPDQRTVRRLRAGKREAAPAGLFAKRSAEEKYVNEQAEKGQRDPGSESLKRCQAPGRTITLSTKIAGTPMKANRYHRSPTRHSTIRRNKRPIPILPLVTPVMMNAKGSYG